jgi:glutamate-1-semialdehyde 2,1-aminomutase
MPVGAYGGKQEIMDFVSPVGPVYQAGTLSGNPVAMAAGYAMLQYLHNHPEIYPALEANTSYLVKGIRQNLSELGLSYTINQVGSMFSLFFTDQPVTNFAEASQSDTALFGKYFREMLSRGVYLAPSQYETLFVSTAISHPIADQIIAANAASLKAIL